MVTVANAGSLPISGHDRYCEGTTDHSRYVTLVNVAVAKVPQRFGQAGSPTLDEICAFDAAEVARLNMGLLNVVQLSSFCGPDAFIWGHDLARADRPAAPLFSVTDHDNRVLPVHDGEPLILASRGLLGTVRNPRFPIRPGCICPAALKYRFFPGAAVVFSSVGIGIAAEPRTAPCVFMENVGSWSVGALPADRRQIVQRSLAQSILEISVNQRTAFQEIIVAYAEAEVVAGELACGLVMIPYVTLARQAIPSAGFDRLRSMSLDEWSRACPSGT